MSKRPLAITLLSCACVGLLLPFAISAQESSLGVQKKVVVQADGTVEIPEQTALVSTFLNPEAKAYLSQHLKDMQDPEILKQDAGVPRFMKPYITRDYQLFAVDRRDEKIAGVHVYNYTPKLGVTAKNENPVLINLHGGGFSGCWPGCAELESIPIAALGKIEVVSVDYREGPNNKFPAASEDVASVYQDLLKNHKSQDIGIYGCSAGGMQTAMSIAWFEEHTIPLPGAIGIFCASAGGIFGGDALYTAIPIGEARLAPPIKPGARPPLSYFADKDALNVMIKFFDRHLGGVANLRASAAPANEVR